MQTTNKKKVIEISSQAGISSQDDVKQINWLEYSYSCRKQKEDQIASAIPQQILQNVSKSEKKIEPSSSGSYYGYSQPQKLVKSLTNSSLSTAESKGLNTNIQGLFYVVVDIEATSLDKQNNKIIQIAAVKMLNGEIFDQFHSLVNPEVPISEYINKLTGIDDLMVAGAPKISEILPQFQQFMEDGIFVAHNVSFDFTVIQNKMRKHCNRQLKCPTICTLKLADRLLPKLGSKKLSGLCEHFQIKNQGQHRALGDTVATAKIFNELLKMLQVLNVVDKKSIIDFQNGKNVLKNENCVKKKYEEVKKGGQEL